MSSLDSQNIFGSGPHSIQPGSWQRAQDRRGFAGLDGELILDMGLRSRTISQTGRLQSDSAAQLQELLSQIEAVMDGQPHTLVGNHGNTYESVILEHFLLTTPLKRGRGFIKRGQSTFWT